MSWLKSLMKTEDEFTRRHEAVVWVSCGRPFIAAKSPAVVITAGSGVVANNGGVGDDNTMKYCSCLLSECESEPSATLGSVRQNRHFKADQDMLHLVIQMGIIFWQSTLG